MNIHEYQAKQLLAKFGVPIPVGGVAHTAEEAVYQSTEIGGSKWVVKAQIHSGARGKAGGVKLCRNDNEVSDATTAMLGKTMVTHQTGPAGKPVSRVYVEAATDIDKELYFSIVMDRGSQYVTLIASTQGGMDIEAVAEKTPEAITTISIDPAVGLQTFQARQLAFALELPAVVIGEASKTIMAAYRTFRDLDANLLEINPLVLTKEQHIIALDAKMTFDENALFRQSEVAELRDTTQEDPRETRAGDQDLSYVGLEGHIGCMINGAGLAMATMDMIQHAGGEPANFLDIGGGASPERVEKAIELVLSDDTVQAILINIFAGINRCDWVAQGIVDLLNKRTIDIPLVVRLSGTNVEEGQRILKESGQDIITSDTLADAATKVVEAWKQAQA